MSNITFVNLCEKWARYAPNKIAITTATESITWLDLAKRIDGLVSTLRYQNVHAGKVVCLAGRSELSLVLRYLACLQHGAVPALVANQPLEQLTAKFDTLYPPTESACVWGGMDSSSKADEYSLHSIDRGEVEQSSSQGAVKDLPPGSSIASIVFTSGSTGQPKAVVHSADHHIASVEGLLEKFQYSSSDTWLLSLPMFHVSGLAIVWRWLVTGGGLRIASGDFASDIAKVTHASLVSTQLKRIVDNGWDTKLKRVLLGGSHIPHELIKQAQLQGIEAWMGYGMTETASTVTAKRVDSHPSSGYLLPRREIKVESERIYVAGDTLAAGYYVQGKLRQLELVDGWFDTKDLGRWSEQGELVVVGRADNLFISGGENVHCEEVEAALNQLSDISQSIVVPVEDAEFGTRCIAVVQCDNLPTVNAMNDILRPHLPKFKHPIGYVQMPEHLLSSGIKVSRKAVKTWLRSAQSDFIVIS